MKVSELKLTRQDYQGDYAYFFNINAQYSGYTRDKELWHVLDKKENAYSSYLTNELESWLNSNGQNSDKNYNTDDNKNKATFDKQTYNLKNNTNSGTTNYIPYIVIAGLIGIFLIAK